MEKGHWEHPTFLDLWENLLFAFFFLPGCQPRCPSYPIPIAFSRHVIKNLYVTRQRKHAGGGKSVLEVVAFGAGQYQGRGTSKYRGVMARGTVPPVIPPVASCDL